jgi:hypothetical protein
MMSHSNGYTPDTAPPDLNTTPTTLHLILPTKEEISSSTHYVLTLLSELSAELRRNIYSPAWPYALPNTSHTSPLVPEYHLARLTTSSLKCKARTLEVAANQEGPQSRHIETLARQAELAAYTTTVTDFAAMANTLESGRALVRNASADVSGYRNLLDDDAAGKPLSMRKAQMLSEIREILDYAQTSWEAVTERVEELERMLALVRCHVYVTHMERIEAFRKEFEERNERDDEVDVA